MGYWPRLSQRMANGDMTLSWSVDLTWPRDTSWMSSQGKQCCSNWRQSPDVLEVAWTSWQQLCQQIIYQNLFLGQSSSSSALRGPASRHSRFRSGPRTLYKDSCILQWPRWWTTMCKHCTQINPCQRDSYILCTLCRVFWGYIMTSKTQMVPCLPLYMLSSNVTKFLWASKKIL